MRVSVFSGVRPAAPTGVAPNTLLHAEFKTTAAVPVKATLKKVLREISLLLTPSYPITFTNKYYVMGQDLVNLLFFLNSKKPENSLFLISPVPSGVYSYRRKLSPFSPALYCER